MIRIVPVCSSSTTCEDASEKARASAEWGPAVGVFFIVWVDDHMNETTCRVLVF